MIKADPNGSMCHFQIVSSLIDMNLCEVLEYPDKNRPTLEETCAVITAVHFCLNLKDLYFKAKWLQPFLIPFPLPAY